MARIVVRVNGDERVFEGTALEADVNLEEAAREAIAYLGQFVGGGAKDDERPLAP